MQATRLKPQGGKYLYQRSIQISKTLWVRRLLSCSLRLHFKFNKLQDASYKGANSLYQGQLRFPKRFEFAGFSLVAWSLRLTFVYDLHNKKLKIHSYSTFLSHY